MSLSDQFFKQRRQYSKRTSWRPNNRQIYAQISKDHAYKCFDSYVFDESSYTAELVEQNFHHMRTALSIPPK